MSLYMKSDEALASGFTHHGRMFSIPCWVTDDDFAPMVAAKFAPFEVWISICTFATQLMGALGMDVGFSIQIRQRIDDKKGYSA